LDSRSPNRLHESLADPVDMLITSGRREAIAERAHFNQVGNPGLFPNAFPYLMMHFDAKCVPSAKAEHLEISILWYYLQLHDSSIKHGCDQAFVLGVRSEN